MTTTPRTRNFHKPEVIGIGRASVLPRARIHKQWGIDRLYSSKISTSPDSELTDENESSFNIHSILMT
ncbi:MAG: hypothetical protein KME15_22040 [Drouetiella hepatica Uher 2000/2452]|uniref:Uncharacterized protein n=1 Tax=Drouetiella hepatica Uher 2000/2452 TaxID=904376 RepID=A0A951QF20_9CYAN|nr:hypothetical protein [Drouetiella hepatica Uher 2000/2452]